VKSFIRTTHIDGIPSNELFAWHIREGAFERLNPPWQQFKVIERKGNIHSDGTVNVRMKIAGSIHTTWLVKHSDYIEGKQFKDSQIKGLGDYFFINGASTCHANPASLPALANSDWDSRAIISVPLNKVSHYTSLCLRSSIPHFLYRYRV